MIERKEHEKFSKQSLVFEPRAKYAAIRFLSSNGNPDMLASNVLSNTNDLESLVAALNKPPIKKAMNIKYINIVDPCFSRNNLGKSISLFNSHRMKMAMKLQHTKLTNIYDKANESNGSHLFEDLLSVFRYSFASSGAHPTMTLKIPQITVKDSVKFSTNANSNTLDPFYSHSASINANNRNGILFSDSCSESSVASFIAYDGRNSETSCKDDQQRVDKLLGNVIKLNDVNEED
eukprot:CAMPEP_0116886644 /NCGR_PEP_ID=MMETSP0463-20121206/20585_1 /TAXON_ID=181622 /ORGANISM="Strombidinopsis sp, Strain SopsisLIS2011" /LENGTH=233 /DNA_ID=CAMNT_0004547453 /DNA_START=752 /DNA_END=1453 /DNA_ORIENTATION=-